MLCRWTSQQNQRSPSARSGGCFRRSTNGRICEDNASAIAQICQRLDGIPLALELAAARVNALTVEQIASRLDDGLGLLDRRPQGIRPPADAARHDWSYELLGQPERLLLGRLAVFAGG